MNTALKTKLVLLAALTFVATASGFYNPEKGRWLSRDPIGEPGFALVSGIPTATHDADSEFGVVPTQTPNEPNMYALVRNEPQSRIDALGLISFDRCSPEKEATLTAAWNAACAMINDPKFQCCVNDSRFTQMFRRRCAWGNVKFKCRNNDEGLCPYVCAHAWQSLGVGRGVIVVCDRDPSECGVTSWKCLLAHEFAHVLGWDPAHGGITRKVDQCCGQP